jgi:hypothetical protein
LKIRHLQKCECLFLSPKAAFAILWIICKIMCGIYGA